MPAYYDESHRMQQSTLDNAKCVFNIADTYPFPAKILVKNSTFNLSGFFLNFGYMDAVKNWHLVFWDYDIPNIEQNQYITVLYKMHPFLRKDWFLCQHIMTNHRECIFLCMSRK